MDSETQDAIDEAVSCPVCLGLFQAGGLIFQCTDGHPVCHSCHTRLTFPRKCPVCRGHLPGTTIRNRACELIVTTAISLNFVTLGAETENDATGLQGRRARRRHSSSTFPIRYCCNGLSCAEKDGIRGPRFKCTECENQNYCESCVKKETHRHHLLCRIPKLSQGDKVNRVFENWLCAKKLAEGTAVPRQLNDSTGESTGSATNNACNREVVPATTAPPRFVLPLCPENTDAGAEDTVQEDGIPIPPVLNFTSASSEIATTEPTLPTAENSTLMHVPILVPGSTNRFVLHARED